jgi:hypothetical protein
MQRRIKYAETTVRSATLSGEFGLKWATDLFGEEAIASLPRLKSGPHKGQPKGAVHWCTAVSAGWCRERSVAAKAGQLIEAWISESAAPSTCSNAMLGLWMGRMQPLAGAKSVLFQEARERNLREREAVVEELELMRLTTIRV